MSLLSPPIQRACALLALLVPVACSSGGSAPAPDPYEHESRGGKLHNLEIENFNAMNESAVATLFAATARDTGVALRGLSPDDFDIVSSNDEVTPAGRQLSHVRLRQKIEGIPIWGTHLAMSATTADTRGPARLLASSHHVYGGVKVNLDADFGEAKAEVLARDAIRADASAEVAESKLVLWPLEGSLDLVYSIRLHGSDVRALVYATGDLSGRVLRVDERRYETAGTVSAHVAIGGAPGSNGVPTLTALPRTTVNGDGATTVTGADGTYVIEVVDGTLVSAALSGIATAVNDETGLVVSAEAAAAAVTDLTLGDPNNVLAVAGATAYFFVDHAHAFLAANGIEDPALLEISTNVNIADACNAFYSPLAGTINFFQAGAIGGSSCNNTAEASIVMHEYGHFVDDKFGGITNSGLSEGWGDLLACLILADPGVGPDFFSGDDTPLRTCDNTYQFPASGTDEVHALGQAWAGFGWHAREGLIAALGEAEGDALARQLLLPSLPSNAADIPAAVRETFIRDDDDGDLSNLTPHWDILLAAAELHSLAFIVDEDLVAPAAVTDLAGTATATSAQLTWTATGDDGNEGTADSYDIRRSSQPITETNFNQAIAVAGPVPLEAGNQQTVDVAVAPGETVFFALRVRDEQNNASAISNVIEVTADVGGVVFEDGFEQGAAGWEATGLWHVSDRKASEGSSAFWYGDEATGNYDTGATNSGTLVSPVIDLAGAENPVLVWDTSFDVEAGDTFDRMTITVFDANDETIAAEISELDGFSGGFRASVLGLAGLADRQVRIRFTFDTVDAVANTTEGWFIDNVRIVADNEVATSSLIINEVLADPGAFDANNDGVLSSRDDEFIELVNAGTTDIDLGGVTIADAIRVRFTFTDGTTLPAGSAVVVFGGGTANIGTPAFVASSLGLNNTGDTITVRAADGATLAEMTYGAEGAGDVSLNRETDGDGASAFVLHSTLSVAPASPGTRVDGAPFGDGPPPVPAALLINEVLADPGAIIDSNGDGVVNSGADEFIELVNIGGEAINLSGATVADAIGVRLTLASGTVLEPGGVLVIFGGGNPDPGAFAGATVVVGGGTLFLNNGGDSVTVASASGDILAAVSFGASDDVSLTRATDLDPDAELVEHDTVSSQLASPGRRSNGAPF